MYVAYGKRLLDLALTIPTLILLAPLFAVLALFVRLKLAVPVIFRQQRPGLHGRPFTLLKFRTMTDARDAAGALLPDEDRLVPGSTWGQQLQWPKIHLTRLCRDTGSTTERAQACHIKKIDDALAKLGPSGEVRIIKQRGKLRFIQKVESMSIIEVSEK